MKENKYDNKIFFNKYKEMERSVNGLKSAGEWHELRKMLPDFTGKRVLDLGCGFGWHCIYAAQNGAMSVTGIDISEKMLEKAREKATEKIIQYINKPIEDIDFANNSFDVVISSLAFHYIQSFDNICKKISDCLIVGGDFVFSIEHPVFTANGSQDWYYDDDNNRLHWPVDNYFNQGEREAVFLGETVVKYHRTLTTYINSLLKHNFEITSVIEPQPEPHLLNSSDEMKHELRRPMMLLISAVKKQ